LSLAVYPLIMGVLCGTCVVYQQPIETPATSTATRKPLQHRVQSDPTTNFQQPLLAGGYPSGTETSGCIETKHRTLLRAMVRLPRISAKVKSTRTPPVIKNVALIERPSEVPEGRSTASVSEPHEHPATSLTCVDCQSLDTATGGFSRCRTYLDRS